MPYMYAKSSAFGLYNVTYSRTYEAVVEWSISLVVF